MPYILVGSHLKAPFALDETAWMVAVSGLKESDIQELIRFPSTLCPDDVKMRLYYEHPCVILNALEILGYRVVAASNTVPGSCLAKRIEINYMWTMRKDFPEPEPGAFARAGSQERTSSMHQRKSHAPRRISQWPFLSMRTSGYSPLQSKIHQEQLLERRALRRAAELELRRKTLELERFQWEYERDKAQTEIRWTHETRMMQLKEEREKQLIEQNRTHTVSNVI